MKERKWVSIILVVVVMFLGFSVRIYGVSNDITQAEVQSPNTLQNRTSIAEKVLTATGRTEMFQPEEARNVTIYTRDLLGDGKNEIIVVVEFGPKNSIVAVYQPVGDNYQYVGDVGEFFYIRNIQFMPIPDLGGKNVMFIREYAAQDIGAFERSSFIKGYLWDNEQFRQVLKVPEGIEASWNELWDGTTNGQNKWKRIEQRTDITFQDGGDPVLNLVHYQGNKVSTDTQSKELPSLDTFETLENRVVSETFRWSDEWRRFILSEKIENQTGQKVAVIEDFATSPYSLLEEYGELVNKVRIERENGETDVVDRNTLRDIEGQPSVPTFIYSSEKVR